MRLMKTFATTAVAASVALGASAAAAETTIHVGNAGEPDSLDPHHMSGTWENRISGDMFLGLTTEAADGTVVPGAAESWQVSDDGTVYTFKIRGGHNWSDGQPVTADDFVFSLRRILAPETAAKYASLLYTIKNAEDVNTGAAGPEALGVRAIDSKKLEITLKAPTPYFLTQLTHYTSWPVPKHQVEAMGADWTTPGKMVSNGAYTVTEWLPNTHVKLVKNPEFFDAANVSIDNVYYYPTEERNAALKRFRAGELDATYDFASDQIEWLRENLPDQHKIAPYLGIYYYPFNTTKPPFDDKRVRQALSMAVDRKAITDKVLRTGELPAYSFVPPLTSRYTISEVTWKDVPYKDRVAQAKALLGEAGYGPDNPLELTLRYNTSENHKKVAIAVAAMWKQLGIKTELFNTEIKVHYNDLEEGDFQVARAAWVADYDDAQNFLYLLQTSTGAMNFGRYSHPDFDRLMDKASVTVDLEARAELMHQAEAIAMEDQPIIPIYYYVSKNLVSSAVGGWVDNAKDIHRTRWLSMQ